MRKTTFCRVCIIQFIYFPSNGEHLKRKKNNGVVHCVLYST